MTPEVARLSGELAAMLQRESVVDPRSRPIRFHNLRAAGSCAAHYLESFQEDGEQTLALRLGSGSHAILTGTPVALWDQPSDASLKRRAKAEAAGEPLPPLTPAPRSGKDWDKFEAEHRGKTILIRSEYEDAVRFATAIKNHERASALLYAPGAVHEDTLLWEQVGRSRRSTPDVRGHDYIAEIKTTRCAKPEVFRWDVRRFGYHAQLADQAAAFQHKFGRKPREAFIIAVEKKRPYVVQVYRLTPNDIEQGARLCRLWFEAARVAEESNCWDGYAAGTVDLDLPMEEEPDLEFGGDDDDDAGGDAPT